MKADIIKKSYKRQITKGLLIFLFFLLILILCGLFVEIFARFIAKPKLKLQDVLVLDSFIVKSDNPILIYTNKPNYYEYQEETGAEYYHNDRGFRSDQNYSKIKPFNITRILILGDSIAYGANVNQSDIFSKILEKKLNTNNKKYEVLNAAVGGYNTLQEKIWFEKKGLSYNPDIVLLAYDRSDYAERLIYQIDQKIYTNHIEMPPIPLILVFPEKITFFLAEKSKAYQLLNLGIYQLLKENIKGKIKYYDPSMEVAKKAMEDLHNICKKNNISLLVIVFPELSSYENQEF